MRFDCAVKMRDGVGTVTPAGDVDLQTTPALREALGTVITDPDTTRVEIDLSRVTFLDSTGIGVLMAAYKAAARKGVSLRVRHPGPMVRMVLELAGVYDVLLSGELPRAPKPVGAAD